MPENGQRQLGLTGGSAGACPCCPEVRQPSRAGGRILAWLLRGCRVDEEACRGEGLRAGVTGQEERGALVGSAGGEMIIKLISRQSSLTIQRFSHVSMVKIKSKLLSVVLAHIKSLKNVKYILLKYQNT